MVAQRPPIWKVGLVAFAACAILLATIAVEPSDHWGKDPTGSCGVCHFGRLHVLPVSVSINIQPQTPANQHTLCQHLDPLEPFLFTSLFRAPPA